MLKTRESLLTSVCACSGTEWLTLPRWVCTKGYMAAPVMYNSAPAPNSDQTKEEIQMENMASSPTDALLTSSAQVSEHPLLLSVNNQMLIISFFPLFFISFHISLFGQT